MVAIFEWLVPTATYQPATVCVMIFQVGSKKCDLTQLYKHAASGCKKISCCQHYIVQLVVTSSIVETVVILLSTWFAAIPKKMPKSISRRLVRWYCIHISRFPGFPLFYMVWGSYLDSSVTIMVILASHPAISMILQLHISSCNSM